MLQFKQNTLNNYFVSKTYFISNTIVKIYCSILSLRLTKQVVYLKATILYN